MKINIVYFSGTGNSKYVARYLDMKLKESGHTCKIASIEKDNIIDEDIELLIIGGPIYASNVPEKLLKWINKNVPKKNAKAIVYSTSAGTANAHGVEALANKLDKKGYKVIGKEIYKMPSNFYFGKYSKSTDEEIKVMLNNVRKQSDNLVSDINSNNLKLDDKNNENVILRNSLAKVFSGMAKFIGKNFSTGEECIKCGICIKECPKNNISFTSEGNIKFGNKCMACARCIHICPNNAINYKGVKYEQYKINEYIRED